MQMLQCFFNKMQYIVLLKIIGQKFEATNYKIQYFVDLPCWIYGIDFTYILLI